MGKLKKITPSYMKDFACIAGACEDTCCAGWYIGIDEATYKKYKKVKDPKMKKRLDKELVAKKNRGENEEVAKIKLKNNRCAFLDAKGLCDIYTSLGENYLSRTCTFYPRNINQINETLEYSLTCSCPEAARKILLSTEGIQFEVEQVDKKGEVPISAVLKLHEEHPKVWQDLLLPMRRKLIDILQKEDIIFNERYEVLMECLANIDRFIKSSNLKGLEHYLKEEIKAPKAKASHFFEAEKAVTLLVALKCVKEDKKWQGKRYEALYNTLLEDMALEQNAPLKEAVKKALSVQLEETYKKSVEPFILQNQKVFENYFVNYIYERLVPLDAKTAKESLKSIELYKELILLHLTGIGLKGEEITEATMVKVVQAISKNFDHNDLYRIKLLKYLKE